MSAAVREVLVRREGAITTLVIFIKKRAPQFKGR